MLRNYCFHSKRGNIFKKFPIVIFLSFILASCASNTATHIAAFSKASVEISSQMIKGYQMVEDTTIRRKIVDVAADPTKTPTENTFVGVLDGEESYKVRMKALNNLRSYSVALGELSSADFRAEIDKASKDLYGSLTGLSATYKKVTGKEAALKIEDLAIISTAIDAFGSAIVEKKRRNAIKQIVINADPTIQEISTLLKDELSTFINFVKANLFTIEAETRKSYQKEAIKLGFENRIKVLVKIQKLQKQVSEVEKFFKSLGIASAKLGKAHSTLRIAVEKNTYTTPELVEQIGELVDFAKSIKKFHKDLTSSK